MRERNLDLFRCAAVFMIVFLHAWGAASQYAIANSWELHLWTFLAAHCTSAAMPALFLISGYLLFQNFSWATWPSKMARRTRRLIVPYVCWNTVFVLFYLSCGRLFPRVGARVDAFGLTTLHGCLAKIIHPVVDPIDFPVWYMRTIFVFALLSPTVWIFLRHPVGRWLLLSVACTYFCACEADLMPTISAYPAYAVLTFIVGGLLAAIKRPIGAFFHNPWWILPGALSLVLHGCSLFGLSVPLGFASKSLLLMPLFFWFFGRFVPADRIDTPQPTTLFFIYTGHFLFCSVWVHALAPMMTAFASGKLTILIVLFLLPGLAVLLKVHLLAKRYLPKIIRLLDGSL